jgi:N-acetylglucosaminyldiphosphoundecaprenol N-acetyl-beta-D-mannosaminyltransferase
MTALSDTTVQRMRLMSASIDCVTQGEAAMLCRSWASDRGATRNIVTLNARTVVLMQENAALREAVERAALIVADGISISLASRMLRTPLRGRIPGIDLMTTLLAEAHGSDLSCFFLGARPEVVDVLRRTLPARYPRLRIAGLHHGYFDRSETDHVVAEIRRSSPDYLFVGLGQPEDVVWCHRHGPRTGASVTMSVGGSLDVLSGAIRRAPLWMQRAGVEWFWRFLLEPRKRFRGVAVDCPRFLALVAKEWVASRRALRLGGR